MLHIFHSLFWDSDQNDNTVLTCMFFSIGNCSAAHNLTFSLSTIFNGTILDTVANPHYQFRIDLSPADHCHCLTVDSATGVIGNIIFNQWRDGSFWCGSNITRLCASSSDNVTFYSALISQNGSLLRDDGSPLCDNSTDASIIVSNAQFPVIQTCSDVIQGLLMNINHVVCI